MAFWSSCTAQLLPPALTPSSLQGFRASGSWMFVYGNVICQCASHIPHFRPCFVCQESSQECPHSPQALHFFKTFLPRSFIDRCFELIFGSGLISLVSNSCGGSISSSAVYRFFSLLPPSGLCTDLNIGWWVIWMTCNGSSCLAIEPNSVMNVRFHNLTFKWTNQRLIKIIMSVYNSSVMMLQGWVLKKKKTQCDTVNPPLMMRY